MTGFLTGLIASMLILVGLYFLVPAGWKTRIYGALTALVGVLEGARQILMTTDTTWLSPQVVGGLTLGSGIVIILLRQITTTPPGKKA